MNISFDRYSFILDGQREFIRSGAMHYFRLPHQNLWWDRLKKLKMSGYNTVDLYFSWDFHSKAPGQYDFNGIRNIQHLLDMVEELGLYLIARPGPYINAETTRGGLPGWLLTESDVVLRNREDGAYHYSPRYMAFVKEWFDHVLPFLKNRSNLLMIQVENEYVTLEMEPDYLLELAKIIRNNGIDVPTMHNDFYAAGLYADIVDIYAIDNYSVTTFEWDWRSFPNLFSVIDHLETGIREEFCAERPMMVAELQAGWFAGWKGLPYKTIHESLGREHISLVTRSFIGQGGTAFNHYKAIGGTNWDHIGATDSYTSYDFSAPISEEGLPTDRLYEAKRINNLLSSFDLSQTNRVNPEEIGLQESDSLYTVRQDRVDKNTYWIFTRNLTPNTKEIILERGLVIEILPYQAKIIPLNLKLKNHWMLQVINVEPLAQTPHCLILPGDSVAMLEIKTSLPISVIESDTTVTVTHMAENCYRLCLMTPVSPRQLVSVKLGDYMVYFLGLDLIDRLWTLDSGCFLIGPDIMLSLTDAYFAASDECWKITTDGALKEIAVCSKQSVALPTLTNWQVVPGETGLNESEEFKTVSDKGSDMDSNGYFEGAVWYRYSFTGIAKYMSIKAQHIWAVFLNDKCLMESHTFHVHPETGGPEDIVSIQIPEKLINPHGENIITIFTESLGHHKGFYDDTRDPRGLLSLSIDGKDVHLDMEIKEACLSHSETTIKTDSCIIKQEFPILHACTEFVLAFPPEIYMPIGLQLDLDIERVNIKLNGILLGKYWRSCKNQTIFYLPEGILKYNGTNHLELTLINFLPMLSMEKSFPISYGKVNLIAYQTFTKLSV